jgi:hypothetical protein
METPDLRRDPAERAAAAVLPVSAAVWGAAEIMHLAGIHAGPDIAGAGAVAFAVAWGAAGRGWSSAPLWGWAAVYGEWFAAAEAFGPLHWWPAPALTFAWAGISVTASRIAHRDESVVAAREWREARADWLGRSRDWGLGGSHLLAFERTRLGELYTVSTKGTGRRASHFVGHSLEEFIAEAEDLAVSRVRVIRHHLAGRIRISVRRVDPWADSLLHPVVCEEPEVQLPASRSIRQPAFVGQDPETGEVLAVPLWDVVGAKNVSVTGMVGAGKGVLLDDISEWVTDARDALQVRINLSDKGHQEIESWGPSCHLTAFGEDQKSRAVAVLKIISGVIAWRTRAYKRGQYQPSPADPLIVVIVDESDEAAKVPDVREGLNKVATKGREYGIAFVHAGQRGTNDYSSAKQRSQDGVRCTGAVNRQGEVRHAAGNQAQSVPDMASYAEGQPGVWSIAVNGAGVRTGRTWVFGETPAAHGAEVERMAQERAFAQPELPPACREYLGETYETLLKSEVFARWARARGVEPFAEDGAPGTSPAVPGEVLRDEDGVSREAVAAPGSVATAEDDPFARLERDMDEETRGRFAALNAKLDGVRQVVAETAAMPRPPEVAADAIAAVVAERWRQVGEAAQIPAEAHGPLLEMLEHGTTTPAVARRFEVSKWTARTWLENLRGRNVAYVAGERSKARWRLAPPPEEAGTP